MAHAINSLWPLLLGPVLIGVIPNQGPCQLKIQDPRVGRDVMSNLSLALGHFPNPKIFRFW